MRLLFLFLFFGSFASLQVPVVSNYPDFMEGISENQPTALRMESDLIRYGAMVHVQTYQEVLPVDEEHLLLIKETFESLPPTVKVPDYQAKGDSYLCLCQKNDLLKILERWKDGQQNIDDYAKFDCKYRSFTNPDDMFHGESFWKEKDILQKLKQKNQDTEIISLSENVKFDIFKNKNNATKKVIKVIFPLPIEHIVKEVEDESFLISAKSDNDQELYQGLSVQGWKSLFPQWKEYQELNTGFWGKPRKKSNIKNNQYAKSFTIAPNNTKTYNIKGQSTFLVRTNQQKTKSFQHLTINQNGRYIKGESYLDYGEYLHHGTTGLAGEEQKITIAFDAAIPISSISVFDGNTGIQLGETNAPPFELNIPNKTTEINVKITYPKLKKVQINYSTIK